MSHQEDLSPLVHSEVTVPPPPEASYAFLQLVQEAFKLAAACAVRRVVRRKGVDFRALLAGGVALTAATRVDDLLAIRVVLARRSSADTRAGAAWLGVDYLVSQAGSALASDVQVGRTLRFFSLSRARRVGWISDVIGQPA